MGDRQVGEKRFVADPGEYEACEGEGYPGRISIYEILPMQEEIAALSLERSSADEISRGVRAEW